jgi:hypothetical protein
MPLKLNSSGGGAVTLDVPSTTSTFTLTAPARTGNIITSADTETVTPTMMSQKLTIETAKTASNTSVDFTGIPSWVKRITVMMVGLSTSGSSQVFIRLGTSSGIVSSGYLGAADRAAAGIGPNATTAGFSVEDTSMGTASVRHGLMTLCHVGDNSWVFSGTCAASNAAELLIGAGSVTLSGVLDRVRVTTANGTDTFDAGTINIMYEG